MRIHYDSRLKDKAIKLRNNPTFAERLLWKHIKGRQLFGYQFMRQKPIDKYIVDFYCSNLKLIIEIDGISHHGKQGYDQLREKRLKELGFSVIRLDGYYILNHINESLEVIAERIRIISGVTTP
jgi:very-short-patch-repair endonuclease